MEDELVLPITTVEAIYMEDGKTLNDEINDINSSLDNIEDEKATRQEVDVERKRIDNIDSSLDNNMQKVNSIIIERPMQYIPKEKLEKVRNKVNPPNEFTWIDAPINIYRNGLGDLSTDLDVSKFQHNKNGKIYYVNLNTGNDNNDGLTVETPLKSVHVARTKPDVEIIEISEGFYDDMYAFNSDSTGVAGYKNLTLRAKEGDNVILSTRRKLSWTKTDGKNYVYQSNRTRVGSVWDSLNLDKNGDYSKLNRVSSIEECDLKENTYYYDDATIYIHPLKNRVADDNIVVFLSLTNFKNLGNYTVFARNIKFYGGGGDNTKGACHIENIEDNSNPLFVAENCEFKYTDNGSGGLAILGADSILKSCIASCNFADGFNYHRGWGRIAKAIEVDCIGRSNGIGRGTNTDNGSTMHDGGKIIRVNCEYYENEGPNCHDVTEGSESWNIGVNSHNSNATLEARNSNYNIEGGKMWLDGCVGYDSFRKYTVTSTGSLYLRNSVFGDGEEYVTGVKQQY